MTNFSIKVIYNVHTLLQKLYSSFYLQSLIAGCIEVLITVG